MGRVMGHGAGGRGRMGLCVAVAAAAMIVWGGASASGMGTGVPPLTVVKQVDLKRYVGTWYEIASFPHSFQRGCVGSKATYTLRDDGDISVLNECRKGSLDGEIDSVQGKAWVDDPETNAKLKVSFFWPFRADYWIIDLGENYEYAVVGHPSRNYLWILSRTTQMDETLYNRIVERLQKGQGYDTSRLQKTLHPKSG